MKSHHSLKVIALACGGALASCATSPETTKVPSSATPRPDSSLSGQLFQEVNAYRRSQGVPDLERHTGLDRLAQQHCEYLRQHRGQFDFQGKNVSHFGSEGRAMTARELYRMHNVSENVAVGTYPRNKLAPAMVKQWAESKGHGYNLRASWTYTGIGVVIDPDGMVFSTQLFATANYSQMAARDRFNRH